MNKANYYSQYSIHEDTNSDFTVLNLHKNDEDFQDIVNDKGSVKTAGDTIHYTKPRNEKSGASSVYTISSGDVSPQVDLVRNCNVKKNLETAVSKLDKLLQYEENLSKRSEIFHCIGTIHSLVSEIKTSESSVNGSKCEMMVRSHCKIFYSKKAKHFEFRSLNIIDDSFSSLRHYVV